MFAGFSFRKNIRYGTITLIDAHGRKHRFEGDTGPTVTIRLADPKLHTRLFYNAQLAVGEAYTDGTLIVEEGDLRAFIDVCIANIRRIDTSPLQRALNRFRDIGAAIRTRNRIGNSRRKVAHHYDLSDTLFDLFLDKDRQYSCAYFGSPDESLETAQYRKKVHIAAKLLLEDGARILDIGSGWGGLGLFLADEARVEVDGVTLSSEQHRVSNDRAQEAGVADRVRFHLKDYRHVDESYDRIVSVGMLEHVGPRHYGEYYRKVASLLTDDGVALIHTIGKFFDPGPVNPWIERYIFPGGYIPALSEQVPWIEKSKLFITDVEVLRLHYAETLRCWYENFQQNRETVANLYDERFCRMWEFYLLGCEFAFRHGILNVLQIQVAKRLETVPLTRDYITDYERNRPITGP